MFGGRFVKELLSSVGIDRGRAGDREVSVNILSGGTALGAAAPASSVQVALPSSGLTFRRLFLPRASKTVRQQVIAEELSYSLPFPLSDAHYGTVERAEDAWVVIASDSVVAPIKDLHPRAALEAEPLCYLRAAKVAGINHALVIDFGASKTVFCCIDNGQVGTVRVLLRGGERLTEELMESAGCTREEAELLKREEGLAHQVVRQFFTELLDEALLPKPLPYRRVLVCGGGSATLGLLKMLNDRWDSDVDVEPFPLPGQLMPTDHVVAYGAALAGRFNATRLQMDHSFRQVVSGAGAPLNLWPLIFSACLMLLMTVSVETRLNGAREREQDLRNTLVTAVSPVIPNAKDLPVDSLVKALNDQLQSQKTVAQSSPGRLMNTLGRGSDAVTSKKDATIYSITFEDNKLKLEGRATSLKQSEDIRGSLESVLVGLEQSKTRPGAGSTIVFQLEGQLPEL